MSQRTKTKHANVVKPAKPVKGTKQPKAALTKATPKPPRKETGDENWEAGGEN